MSGPVIKQRGGWPGHIAIASILGVGAVFVWILLDGVAKVLTNCCEEFSQKSPLVQRSHARSFVLLTCYFG
jgi:hypothetical protein